MIMRRPGLWAATTALFSSSFCNGLAANDIPADTPIASLVSSAKANLASGNSNDALTYFDVAIARDPGNYLTIFQRGATYLSLGKDRLASSDFNKVLSIKPDFEGALLQRAKIKGRSADWDAAKLDYEKAGKKKSEEYEELMRAKDGAVQAVKAEKAKDWAACASHADAAVVVASTALDLRRLRARCRLEQGEVLAGISDLQHVLQLAPGSVDPHLQISSLYFYVLNDTERGLTAVRNCLHSDPESKACMKLNKRHKAISKRLKKVAQMEEKRQYNSAVKILVGEGEESSLLKDIKTEVEEAKTAGTISRNAPNELYGNMVEKTCYLYNEVSDCSALKTPKFANIAR